MQAWPVQEAKARFNEILELCLAEGPQMLINHGIETAVLVSANEWRRLQATARPSLKQLLLSDSARASPIEQASGIHKRRPATGL